MEHIQIILEAKSIAEANPENKQGKSFLRKLNKVGITDEVVSLAIQLIKNK